MDGRRLDATQGTARRGVGSTVRTHSASSYGELDSFDMIEDLALRGGRPVNVLTRDPLRTWGTGGSLLAGRRNHRQIHTVESLIEHWQVRLRSAAGVRKVRQRYDLPLGNRRPNSFGRVIRLLRLMLKVTPIFAPPYVRAASKPTLKRSIAAGSGGRLAAIHISKPG